MLNTKFLLAFAMSAVFWVGSLDAQTITASGSAFGPQMDKLELKSTWLGGPTSLFTTKYRAVFLVQYGVGVSEEGELYPLWHNVGECVAEWVPGTGTATGWSGTIDVTGDVDLDTDTIVVIAADLPGAPTSWHPDGVYTVAVQWWSYKGLALAPTWELHGLTTDTVVVPRDPPDQEGGFEEID